MDSVALTNNYMGKFIAIYGINNIGKSWHAKFLVERLNEAGKKAVYIKFPVYDIEPTGSILNTIIRSGKQDISEEELQLWYTLNRFQFLPKLKALIAENDFIIAEDYVATGICWGSAKGAPTLWLESINNPLPKPDINILMTGERKLNSIEDNHIHETNSTLIEKTEKLFYEMALDRHWQIVEKDEDYEITKKRFWDILVASNPELN